MRKSVASRAPPHLLPRTGKQAAGAIDVSFRRDNRRAMRPRQLIPIGASVDNNADCHSSSCHGNLDDSLSTQPPGRGLSSTGEEAVHTHKWRLFVVLSPMCLSCCSCWGRDVLHHPIGLIMADMILLGMSLPILSKLDVAPLSAQDQQTGERRSLTGQPVAAESQYRTRPRGAFSDEMTGRQKHSTPSSARRRT